MPNLHLTKDQIQALTTFLLGSQESALPASYQYKPQTLAAISRKAGGCYRSTTASAAISSSPDRTRS